MTFQSIISEANSVLAVSPPYDQTSHVLKHADTFAVLDAFGEIRSVGLGEQGVYHYGTRHLSRFSIRMFQHRLLHLGATVHARNALLSVDLTNPDIHDGEQLLLPKDTIHIHRNILLHAGQLLSNIEIKNYGLQPATIELRMAFGADFTDIFEVRGMAREQTGEQYPPAVTEAGIVEYTYMGLDQRVRTTHLRFDPAPQLLEANSAVFALSLDPHEETTLTITASFNAKEHEHPVPFKVRLREARDDLKRKSAADAVVTTSNSHFNSWLDRSAADLHLLLTDTRYGPYPYAGIPWFSTPFGRDAIITALMYLWVNPAPARGVLKYLAATQAQEREPDRDAEPGKIIHEMRDGEMAALDEIPFRRYYGSVDSTPLFILLADAYYRRTADLELLQQLWPHVTRAVEWMQQHGDLDGDGFLEYCQQSKNGIHNQGWKDSNDSVFHEDGRLAQPPIALCEVQGYAYAAYRAAARLGRVLSNEDLSEIWLAEAEQLRKQFEDTFWSEELGTYVLALDHEKRPCQVESSNAGQCLFTGIASSERARRVAQSLLGPKMFSGWGVRTIAEGEARYNPMSYHNGSIWPHDNAMIAWGLAHYNLKDEAMQILESQFQLSQWVDLYRQPELVCGFSQREGAGPTRYPVACSPQAWAAGSVFMLLSATLGLELDAIHQRVIFNHPQLPASVKRLTIEGLQVGQAELDLEVERFRHDVSVNVLKRTGMVRLEINK